MKIFMIAGANSNGVDSLLPVDAKGQLLLARIKPNQLVRVDVRRPRSIKHLRLFWALMETVHKNLPHKYDNIYPTVDSLVDAIKLEVGCFETVVTLSGEILRRPRSIAFHEKGQDEFNDFYNRCCDVVIEHFYPGMPSDDLKREIEQMTGIRMEAA